MKVTVKQMASLGLCAAAAGMIACSMPYAALNASAGKNGVQSFRYVLNRDFANEFGGYDQAVERMLPQELAYRGMCPDGWTITDSQKIESGRMYTGQCK